MIILLKIRVAKGWILAVSRTSPHRVHRVHSQPSLSLPLLRSVSRSTKTPEVFLTEVSKIGDQFDGFNMICGDQEDVWYFSNKDPSKAPRHLVPPKVLIQFLR